MRISAGRRRSTATATPSATADLNSPRPACGESSAHEVRRVRGRFHMREANELKTQRARRLRRAATDAKTALWHRLRSRALNGCKFVRQKPIGPYTVDFICRERRLIIEVDGDNMRTIRTMWSATNGLSTTTTAFCGSGTTTFRAIWRAGNDRHCIVLSAPSPGSHRTMRSDLSPRAGRG
jgi:Protein of unknown function (DUF559)